MKKKIKVLENIQVKEQHHKGRFLADTDKRIAVRYGVPGDVVDIRLIRKRKCNEGQIVSTHAESSARTTPFCDHFGVCGGCRWQNIDYAQQLTYKQNEISDAFQELISVDQIEKIIPSEKIKYYRNKLNFSFSSKKWITIEEMGETVLHRNGLGFHVSGHFDKVADIEHCYLQANPSNEIRLALRDYARKHELSFCNCSIHEGLLRELVIRTTTKNEVMVVVVVGDEDREKFYPLLHFLQETFPAITSLFYIINTRQNNSSQGLEKYHFYGKEYITEYLEDVEFRISPESFFQTNIEQCLQLYRKILELANFNGNEIVYDLYTGVGSIALFLAKHVAKIVGIECVASAIDNAKNNAAINNIENATFIAGNMQEVLNEEFATKHGKPDVVITDPAREGMKKKTTKQLLALYPEKIIYVSCNPTTQAEDIAILIEKYEITYVQPVDMFPHTHHIENIVLLVKR